MPTTRSSERRCTGRQQRCLRGKGRRECASGRSAAPRDEKLDRRPGVGRGAPVNVAAASAVTATATGPPNPELSAGANRSRRRHSQAADPDRSRRTGKKGAARPLCWRRSAVTHAPRGVDDPPPPGHRIDGAGRPKARQGMIEPVDADAQVREPIEIRRVQARTSWPHLQPWRSSSRDPLTVSSSIGAAEPRRFTSSG